MTAPALGNPHLILSERPNLNAFCITRVVRKQQNYRILQVFGRV
jgi:hypothetical protein